VEERAEGEPSVPKIGKEGVLRSGEERRKESFPTAPMGEGEREGD